MFTFQLHLIVYCACKPNYIHKNKEPQGKALESESSYTEDSEEFTDWSEEDEDEDEVRSQNVDEDFIDFPFSGKRHCGDGEVDMLLHII